MPKNRRVLVLGGTAWVGHAIAARFVADGAEVTCLARGVAGAVPAGAHLVVADRTQPGAYELVADTEWDDVVEISWDHEQVVGALAALADRARHWTLISSISVYATHDRPDADEGAPLVEGSDLADYSQAKVAAERASADALSPARGTHGDRLLTARLGLIVGPGDGTDRFGYWVARFALAGDGPVLVPDAAGRSVQVIDVADVADWVVRAGRAGTAGVVDVVGQQHRLHDLLSLAAETAGHRGPVVTATDEWLRAHDVAHWSGPRSLPLWLPREMTAMAQRSGRAFLAAGGEATDLRTTLERTLADERARGLDRERRSGLTRAEELELVAELTAAGS